MLLLKCDINRCIIPKILPLLIKYDIINKKIRGSNYGNEILQMRALRKHYCNG